MLVRLWCQLVNSSWLCVLWCALYLQPPLSSEDLRVRPGHLRCLQGKSKTKYEKHWKNPEIQSTVINLPKSDEQMARWWQAQWKLPHLASCCLWPMMVYVSWSFMIHYVFVFAASATFLSSSRTRWFDRESCSYQGHLGNALVIFSLWISAVIACDWQILAVYSGIMDHPLLVEWRPFMKSFNFCRSNSNICLPRFI